MRAGGQASTTKQEGQGIEGTCMGQIVLIGFDFKLDTGKEKTLRAEVP